MERFLTVQGEGAYTGAAAWFIRLGGCDVGCAFCDVKESWDVNAHPLVLAGNLVDEAVASKAPICVITGGEPAMHDLRALTDGLKAAGLHTHIETSGTHPLTGTWDWVTFSPKRFKAPLDGIYGQTDELKVIVVNRHDLVWGKEHAALLQTDARLYFQPEWDRRQKVLSYTIAFVQENPEWRISLQTHKYLGLP
ncbi:MAG: 7-carboxy-7-deazaguanine synthase QueE [Crocinitomicaceae bacterium]|nr:7-carboxy-7-deazaguanine synthase QueE [Crocinitomicaceae bacterium]